MIYQFCFKTHLTKTTTILLVHQCTTISCVHPTPVAIKCFLRRRDTRVYSIQYSEGLQSTISQRLLCRLYAIPLVMMHISIQQGAATHGAHNYRPGTHLYSWLERGTICVNTLPKGANLYKGWHRTHDHQIMSRTPSPLCYKDQMCPFHFLHLATMTIITLVNIPFQQYDLALAHLPLHP